MERILFLLVLLFSASIHAFKGFHDFKNPFDQSLSFKIGKKLQNHNIYNSYSLKFLTPQFSIENDSTEEKPFQKIVVATHFLLIIENLIKSASVMNIYDVNTFLSVTLAAIISIIVGDFATGVFHWSVDNYGTLKTPLIGSVCAAFQGHHQTPWTITFRSFANNVYKIGFGTIPALTLLSFSNVDNILRIFLTLFITWWMLSQEFHKFAHMTKTTKPSIINKLQDFKIILSSKEHGLHHNAPFEGRYCILNGICNDFLDKTFFFRYLEKIVFKLTGFKISFFFFFIYIGIQFCNVYFYIY
jgi:ubiquitin-conjugating enzyme E2 variant